MTIHTMEASLSKSEEIANLPIWTNFYRLFLTDVENSMIVGGPGLAQQYGLDRRITQQGRISVITADEKVREYNVDYPDVLLEYWSIWRGAEDSRNVVGWVEKPLECDYIAYVWPGRRKALLLPVAQLQLAWKRNKEDWLCKFSTRKAQNNGYTTLSCPVKEDELLQAIMNCFVADLPSSFVDAIKEVQVKHEKFRKFR